MQVNQSVNTANFLLVGNQTGNSVSGKNDEVETKGFASFLEGANQNQQSQSVSKASTNRDISTSDEGKKTDSVDESLEQSDDSVKNVDQSNVVKEVSMEKDIESPTEDINGVMLTEEFIIAEIPVEEMENLSEEELAIVLETISNLLQNVMEQFNLSVEEFSLKLEEFGMESSDLLTQEGLKEFFLQMNNVEVSDLVVDENLNAELKAFLGEMDEELEVLGSITSEINVLVSEEEFEMLLTDLTKVENESIQVKMDMDETEIVPDEPEVIVKNNISQNSLNTSDNEQSQSKSNLHHEGYQETKPVDNHTAKQSTFENPILQAIQNAVNNVEGAIVSEQPIQQADVIRQIVEQVRLNMNQQATSLELQLYPEHLGRIQINVVSKEGVMTAHIVAETEAAKQAIEGGLLNLKEAMQQQDLKVEAIEVMVSTMGFEKNDEQQNSFENHHSSNTRRKIDLSEMGEESSIEDEVEIEKMKASGSSVSYSV